MQLIKVGDGWVRPDQVVAIQGLRHDASQIRFSRWAMTVQGTEPDNAANLINEALAGKTPSAN